MSFLSIIDHVLYRGYLLQDVPVNYGIQSPYVFMQDTAGPIYHPHDGETGRGIYAIVHMVDMRFNKIPFTVELPGDLLDIHSNLVYFGKHCAVDDTAMKNREFREFHKRAMEFKKEIEPNVERIRSIYPRHQLKTSPVISLLKDLAGC